MKNKDARSNKILLNLGLYSISIQKYFWVIGVPYIIISPFLWGSFYKLPPPPPAQMMPVMLVDNLGNAKKLSCNLKEESGLLPLAKQQSIKLTAAMFSWPQNKAEASARMAAFSKYFVQNKNSLAQVFLSVESSKILTESVHSQATFEVSALAADYDSIKNEYIVVLDGIQTILKNDVKTSQKISLDITLKQADENRKNYDEVVLEISDVKVRKNEKI
jgi:hypothetical protein